MPKLTLIRGLPGSGKSTMARKHGAPVEIITAMGDYGSVHNVPAEAIQAMRERWEEVVL